MIIEFIRSLGRSALRSKWAWQDRRLRAELIIELDGNPKQDREAKKKEFQFWRDAHRDLSKQYSVTQPAPEPQNLTVSEKITTLAKYWRDGENPGYYVTDEYMMGLVRSLPNFQYPLSRILIDEHGRREIESPHYAGTIHDHDGFKVIYYIPPPEPPPSANPPGYTTVMM